MSMQDDFYEELWPRYSQFIWSYFAVSNSAHRTWKRRI